MQTATTSVRSWVLTILLLSLFGFSKVDAQTTYYTFQSGNFNDVNVWTTDPSGTLLINSAVPSTNDDIVVLNGRTLTLNVNSLTFGSLVIEESAVVAVGSSTGHDFGTVSGQGTLRLQNATIPTGSYTSFYGSSGGILEFTGTGNFNLPNVSSINTLLITGTGEKTLANDLTLLENLDVESGILTIGNNGTDRSLTIEGDIIVESGGTLGVGNANTEHTITLSGDLINNSGSIVLNNDGIDYLNDPTTGSANIEMVGSANAEIIANGQTDLNRLIINKGNDDTFVVEVTADNAGNFRLMGRNDEANGSTSGSFSPENPEIQKALWIRNGTLHLRALVTIPSLTEGGNDFFIPENGRLWVDGANVTSTTTANGGSNQGITVYGTLQVTSGTLETENSAGIVFRGNATVLVEGGEVGISQFRRSSSGSVNNFSSYIQTGGLVIVDGRGGNNNAVGRFGINQPESAFRMSGGTLRLEDNNGATTGGLQIDSSPDNYSVTGGTIEIIPDGGDFEIGSNAPLYNLELQNGANNVVLTRELTVLNTLDINTGTDFDAAGFDLTVGGDFTIDGTYTPGANTTTIDGSTNSNLTINNGSTLVLNNFTVEKTDPFTDTLFVTNAQPTAIQVDGTFEHLQGVTDMSTYVFDLNGDLTLNSQMGLTANTGELIMTGTAAQTITIPVITNYPAVRRLEIDNANGVTLTGGDMEVLNEVELTSGVFDIQTYELLAYGGVTTTGSFSNTLMIRTAGNNTDGGLTIGSYGNYAITFPFGTNSDYTPVTATISGWSDDGLIQINPADQELATLSTSPGEALQYYWRVRNRDFTTLPNVSYEMNYPNSAVGTSENQYIAGKVVGSTRSTDDPSGSADNVDEATNTITFDDSGSGSFTLETASYTAAQSNRFNGSVRVLYSRTYAGNQHATYNLNNILDWDDGTSWTTDTTTNTPAGTPPGPGDIVIITYGGSHNPNGGGNRHHIMIENSGAGVDAQAAEVIVRDGPSAWASRLYIREDAEAELGTVTGSGDVWYLVDQTNVPNVTADYGEFAQGDGNFNYLRASGNNITITLPATPNEFPNLRMEANCANNIRFEFPVEIQVNQDLTVDRCSIFRPIQNVTVLDDARFGLSSEGILEFPADTGPITFEVLDELNLQNDNDVEIRPENAAPTPAGLTHRLIVHGNIDHETGEMNLHGAGDADINLEFEGGNTQQYNNTSGNIPELDRIIVNKTSGTSVEFTTDFTLNTTANTSEKPIDLQSGTLILNNAGIDIVLNDGGADFTIPQGAELDVTNGTVRVEGTDATGIALGGTLSINGGSVILGDNDGNDDHYIEYTNTGSSTINISAGNLTVGSQIRRDFLTTTGVLTYNQTGGTVEVGRYEVPNNSRATFEILNAGSSFTHTNGSLVITREQPNANVPGVIYDPGTVNATAPFQIGSANTPNSETIAINAAESIGELVVSSLPTGLTAELQINPLTITNSLEIQTGSVFDANGLDVTIGGDFTNDGTFNGSNANVTFNGSGAQSGAFNSITTFHDLTIDKSAGTLTLSGGGATSVTNDFFLLSGTLDDGGKTITIAGDIENSATHTGSGQLTLNGSSAQNISGNGSGVFGSLELNNSSGFVATADFRLNGTMTFTDGIMNIDEFNWLFGPTATVGGSPSATSMIRTDGSLNADGVAKIYATGATDFTFPFGALNKYTPARYNFSSNGTQGTLIVRPVNIAQSSTTSGDDTELSFYWLVSSSGFGSYNVTHEYTYDQADVQTTGSVTEADYVWGRFSGGAWSTGTTGDVNETTNVITISGVGYLDGDFTAGDISEFQALQVYYSSTAKSGITSAPGASWDDLDTWSTVPWSNPNHGTLATQPSQIPNGNQVNIRSGHFVFMPGNSARAGGVEINGTLDLGNTTSHIFGTVTGTGTLINGTTTTVFPSGDFSAFNGPNGGTVEYDTNGDVTLPPQSQYWNLIIQGSANEVRTLPAITLTVLNNIEIRGNARLASNDRTIYVEGNWVNSSSNATPFDPGNTSTVIFNGTNAQTIGSTQPTRFANLTIDNSHTSGVTLNSDITVNRTLTFTNGDLNTGSNTVTLGSNNGALNNETNANRLVGSVQTTKLVATSSSTMGNIGLSFATGNDLGNVTARRVTGSAGVTTVNGGTTISRRWVITADNQPSNRNITYSWLSADDNGKDMTQMRLFHRPNEGTGSFSSLTSFNNVSGSNPRSITASVSSFSEFAASDANSTLPVDLVSFEASDTGDGVLIRWSTELEKENYGFFIERSNLIDDQTTDTTWSEVSFVEGQGTTTNPHTYQLIDKEVSMAGTYLYRIKQVDFDGRSERFGPVETVVEPPKEFGLSQNYPNPFNPSTNINYKLPEQSRVRIDVFNILGRRVSTLVNDVQAAGQYTARFDGSRVASGMYLVRMQVDGRVFTRKMLLIK